MKQKVLDFCATTLAKLSKSNNFAGYFTTQRMEFHRQFQNGLIFSTRFGANFFEETLNHVEKNEPLKAEKGFPLGEYDLNFNKWLKWLENTT